MGQLEFVNETEEWISLDVPNYTTTDFILYTPSKLKGTVLAPGQRISRKLKANPVAKGSMVHVNLRFNNEKIIELRFDLKLESQKVGTKIKFNDFLHYTRQHFSSFFGEGAVASYGDIDGYLVTATVQPGVFSIEIKDDDF